MGNEVIMAKGRKGDAWLDWVDEAGSDKPLKTTAKPAAKPAPPIKKATSKTPRQQAMKEASDRLRARTERINVILDPSFAKAVRLKAVEDEVTVSHVIRSFLEQWIAGELKTP
jgi:hypothetical protein